MKALVIIPAYNESASVAAVVREVGALGLPLDVLVVDDGSTDETLEIAEGAGATTLRLPFNLGYGAAIQTGLLYAAERGYTLCVLIDGDGQHDPRYVPALIAPVADGAADLAIGSRFLGHAAYDIPLARKLGMSLFAWLASLVIRQPITDPTSGFQAIGAELIRFLAGAHYPSDFPDADNLIRLHLAGFRISEVPVTIRPRLRGTSMHGGIRAVYYVYKMLLSIFVVLTHWRTLKARRHHAAVDQAHADRGRARDDADDRAARASTPTR